MDKKQIALELTLALIKTEKFMISYDSNETIGNSVSNLFNAIYQGLIVD